MSIEQLEHKYNNEFVQLKLDDGIVIGICEDSHSSWSGGNMVIKTSDTEVISYMGHVCGCRYLENIMHGYAARMKHENKQLIVSDFSRYVKLQYKDRIQTSNK